MSLQTNWPGLDYLMRSCRSRSARSRPSSDHICSLVRASARISGALHKLMIKYSLGLALSNLTQLTALLSTFLMRWADIENGTVSLERIHDIVSLPPEDNQVPNKGMSPTSIEKQWSPMGSVVFQDVTLRYRQVNYFFTFSI